MKNSIIRGTLILTTAGLISRVIGFYYRIFLSNAIGSEGMGLFQLVFPVLGISFAICVAGIETSISKFVASNKNSSLTLVSGIILSFSMSILMSFLIYTNAWYISERILLNTQCSYLIRILALSIPLSCVHNCINGYYYGLKKATVPALSQLFEQIIRVASVYFIIMYFNSIYRPITSIVAMYGLVIGEISAVFFCAIALFFEKNFKLVTNGMVKESKKIITLSLPLSANRILLTLLQGGEAVLIPAQLIVYGLNSSEALSVYGVLTGMAMPLIFFPSAITNSLSVLLLPTVSKAQADNHTQTIASTVSNAIKYSLIMGIFFTAIFIMYGGKIGALLFHNQSVYSFVMVLAWLCPFMYISTTLGSILNGLGKTTSTCIQNTISIIIRIIFLILLVPTYGIVGYMWGVLLSQIFLCISHTVCISRMYKISFSTLDSIISPMVYISISISISLMVYIPLQQKESFTEILRLLIGAAITGIIYCGLYYFTTPFFGKGKDRLV